MLAAISLIASASTLLPWPFVFGFVFYELGIVSLICSLILSLVSTVWLVWTALRFWRKAKPERATDQVNAVSIEGNLRLSSQ